MQAEVFEVAADEFILLVVFFHETIEHISHQFQLQIVSRQPLVGLLWVFTHVREAVSWLVIDAFDGRHCSVDQLCLLRVRTVLEF